MDEKKIESTMGHVGGRAGYMYKSEREEDLVGMN